MLKKTIVRVAMVAAVLLPSVSVLAQDADTYPDRPVTIIVPYSPGGSTDAVARFIAPLLSEALGQPFVVENKPGASGTIGTDAVTKSENDGYTLLVHTSVIGIHPAFKSNLTYDTQADLYPVGVIATGPFVLNANPNVPAGNVSELVEYAKSHPGELNFGSAGAGSSGHLIAELFMQSTGIDMVHIPYAGGGPSQVGLMSNEVQLVFDTLTSVPFIEEGRLKALAVTSEDRWAGIAEVPTMKEQGFEDSAAAIWIGAFAPAGTPDEIVDKLSVAIQGALKNQELEKRLYGVGLVPVGSTPEQAKDRLDADIAKWQALADSGVSLEK